ncbi:MAG: M1 family metallopeptidase [Candidatus Aminicenantes bacterium]|nr:M1 family metallopeptidase [Candidatus Aminicenantes bacterium]
MKKILLCLSVCLLCFCGNGLASLSRRVVDYKIKARLIPEEKTVAGMETLTWRNESDTAVSELPFHLYLNAFKNNRTTFMRESGGVSRGFKLDSENWGYIEITKIHERTGRDLTSHMSFIQPDDGNSDDQTVMQVRLPQPVLPGESITLDIEFTAKLPRVFARSGFYENFFMVAQWFPKIGVFQEGRWNCHQYHSHSEFFADFGVYEVEITVPKEYIVGATGRRINEAENGDGTVTYTHYQEDVHDFAWTACPDFVVIREKFTLEKPPVETEMILLLYRGHLRLKERFRESLKNGLTFYSRNYGAYPYPTITLVDPPFKALGAGGMEYPTLFTSMGAWFMPDGLRLPEMVTIHEFGHGYWYGMVASNEFEEAWLDEGFNSYSEIKAMEKYYGPHGSMLKIGPIAVNDTDYHRSGVIGSGRLDPILRKSWEFYNGGSYSLNVYSKAALTLLTLERFLGEEVMADIMKAYFEEWKFKHPKTENFIAVAEKVSGRDLSWFFDQFLKSPDKLDYAIGTIRSVEIPEPEGFFKGALKKPSNQKNAQKEPLYRNEVTVVRKGEIVFPQEILVTFENGEEVREEWDGRGRWKKYVYERSFRLKSAQIDPEGKMVLDIDTINNSAVLKPNTNVPLKYGLSWMLKFQKLLSFISM